ncbi:MAG: ABC transporter ATP-binding protein [Phycisphaeraceae bacterium]
MKVFLRLLGYLKPYWPLLLLAGACLIVGIPATLFHPLVWMFVVDEVLLADEPRWIEHARGSRYLLLGYAVTVMFFVHLFGSLVGAFRSYILGRVGQRFVRDLRSRVYRRIQEHALPFFHHRSTGDLMSRTIADIDALEEVALRGTDEILSNTLQFVGVASIIIWLQWQIGLITLIPLTGVGVLVYFFNHRVKGLYRRVRDRLGDVSGKLQENITGILVIKAFAREEAEAERFDERNDAYYRTSLRALLARSFYFPSVMSVGFLSNVAMIGLGGVYVLRDQFTTGGLVAYRGYWWHLFAPVNTLARINEMLLRATAAATRVFELLDEPVLVCDKPDAVTLDRAAGHIRFEQVDFRYDTRDTTLEGITFEALPGQQIGVVGPSGAGKSTLLSLVLRLYDPEQGTIRLDGHDVRDLTQASLRRQFAIVTQEPFLFNETIAENIRYVRPEASDEQIIEAARQANAHEFIADLPQGYDTRVGERGVRLSGGQKQRICIARAFLTDPAILLLDEPTAAVEPESESIIQTAVQHVLEGRTALTVSHRLSMVRDADQILVIDGGRIVQRGTHDELMAAGGWYRRMYNLQQGNGVAKEVSGF